MTLADRLVALAYLASVAMLVVFVVRFATRVPFLDEFSSFRYLFGGDQYRLAALWEQHNEHRIPLPRVLYILAVRLGGLDFRMPIYLNATLLAVAAFVLLVAVRKARGRTSPWDVFLPLVVLSLGQHENLVWGFQVQFVAGTAMFLGVLSLALRPDFSRSTWRVALAGLLTLAQPLCGANGVAFAPALGAMFVALGIRNWRAGRTRTGGLAVLLGLTAWTLVPVYFHGLKPSDHHPPAGSPSTVGTNFVNLMGLGLGPVTHLTHTPGYDGITILGAAMSVLVAVTGAMLLSALRDPERRSQALALGGLLGAALCLAAGLAYGRAGFGSILPANRYVTLVVPIPVVVFVAWVVCGRGLLAKFVPALLCTVAVAAAYSNTSFGMRQATYHADHLKLLKFDIRAGVPLTFLADKHRFVFSGPSAIRSGGFAVLSKHGVKPFDQIVPDPPMTSAQVPIRVVGVEGFDGSPEDFRTVGDHGHVVFALPAERRVIGFRLVYEAYFPNPNAPGSILSWDTTGAFPPGPGTAVLNQLGHTDGPTGTHVFVNGEAAHLRIDVYGRGSKLKVHELHVLTRPDSVE